VLLVAGLTAVIIALTGRHAWWSGWVAALIISLSAAFASLAALAPTLFAGMETAVYGYLGGSVLRTLITLGGCIAAVFIFRIPAVPTLVLASPLYFAQLIVEVAVLGTELRKQKIG
jgi:hypothetical protein